MNKKYIVVLTSEERRVLRTLISSGKAPARRLTRARILLKADRNDSSNGRTEWSDQAISQALDVSVPTIVRVRRSFVKGGLESALNLRKARSRRKPKLDERQEDRLIRLSESKPLRGHRRWTLRSLANKMVQLRYVDSVSHETIRQVLKKRSQPLDRERTVSVSLAEDERQVSTRTMQRLVGLNSEARADERPDTVAKSRSRERRKQERRRLNQYAKDALVVINGIAFIDKKNSGRRQKIRRQKDRKQLAKLLKTFG